MKTGSLPFLAAGLLLWSGSSGRAQVTIESVTREDNEPAPVEVHAFGGEVLALTLRIKGPAGTAAKLTAQLFQAAGELAVPLGEAFPVEVVEFDPQGRQISAINIPLPKVTEKTDIRVRFEAQSDGKSGLAGSMRVLTYPPIKPQVLKVLSGGRRPVIGVFGEDETMRRFLKNNEVPFHDLGKMLPAELDGKMLYVGNASAKALADWSPQLTGDKRIPLVVFSEDSTLLPGVYETERGALLSVKVTMPLLRTLATDPLSQVTFLAVLSQILSMP